MSEDITIGSPPITRTIYGTLQGATDHMLVMFGTQYDAWSELTSDEKKRTLVGARAVIDRYQWNTDADTFLKRDAIAVFVTASYELAAMAAEDPSVLSTVQQGSNIQSVNAGGAGVTYFNPTSSDDGSATTLPELIELLIGSYLASADTSGVDGGDGLSGSCHNPFSSDNDYDRNEGW